MTEKKKTYQGVIFALAMAGVVVCALVCGCTTVGDTSADQGVAAAETTEITVGTDPGSGMPQNPPGNGTARSPDLASAAATLGVTEEELQNALGTGGEGMDLEAAASELGVTVEELQDALGNPPERQMPDGEMPPNGTAPSGTPPATPAAS